MTTNASNRCEFLDVLEEAAKIKTPVTVELRGGDSFTDSVQDVVTESGEDYAQFERRGRVPVSQISRCEPSPRIHDAPSYDDKL